MNIHLLPDSCFRWFRKKVKISKQKLSWHDLILNQSLYWPVELPARPDISQLFMPLKFLALLSKLIKFWLFFCLIFWIVGITYVHSELTSSLLYYYYYYYALLRDYSFNTYAKFPEKITFLTPRSPTPTPPRYADVRERIRW